MQATPLRACAGMLVVCVCAAAGCGGADVREDIAYDTRFGDETTMDVYVPDEAGLHPGVLFIHGGTWRHGSKGEYTSAASRLARSGYVTATINYRLAPGNKYPAEVQDCVCALSFFRAHAAEYKLDPARVAVMGYSAGGHLAALVGVAADAPVHRPDCPSGPTGKPAAVIAGAGWYDFRGLDTWWLRDFLGPGPNEDPVEYAAASPITYVGPHEPPFLFINGSADWLAHIRQAREMRDALLASGNQAELLQVTGGGHLLNAPTDPGDLTIEEADLTPEGWIAVTDFLERTVGRP